MSDKPKCNEKIPLSIEAIGELADKLKEQRLRIAELERQLAEAKTALHASASLNADLDRQLAGAKEDTARLELLLSQFAPLSVSFLKPMNGHGWRLYIDGQFVSEGPTQREAIDSPVATAPSLPPATSMPPEIKARLDAWKKEHGHKLAWMDGLKDSDIDPEEGAK